jgi:hypothetical protein
MLLIGILTLVVGGAVAIMLVVRERSVKATAAAIQQEVSKGLGEKIGERLASAEGIVQSTEHSILKGDLPLDDLTALAERLSERIRFDDRFDVIVFIRPDGSVAGAQQLLDGSLRMGARRRGELGRPARVAEQGLRHVDSRQRGRADGHGGIFVQTQK